MYLMHLLESRFRHPRRREAEIKLRWEGKTAHVSVGEFSFFVRSDLIDDPADVEPDFLLYGAAAIAQSKNLKLVSDIAFSPSVVEAVRRANRIIESWHVRNCFPFDIDVATASTSPPEADTSKHPGLICLSGGVDSTYAAKLASAAGRISHGMLISGADYKDRADPGFQHLWPQVRDIGEALGLTPFVTETSIRAHHKVHWPMTHAFVLAMCLSFHSKMFLRGVIAADFTLEQEFGYHPWGNATPIIDVFGTPDFPIEHEGGHKGRTRKVGVIATEHPDLLSKLSVCLNGFVTGENCGVCAKCVRTRLNLAATGHDATPFFADRSDLSERVAKLGIPKTQAKRRQLLVFLLDIRDDLATGPVRGALDEFIARLKARTIRTGKI